MPSFSTLDDHSGGKRLLWLFALFLAITISTGVGNAQGPLPKTGFLGEFRNKSIVGTWEETVTFPPGVPVPPQKAMVSFHDDGTEAASGQGSVILNDPDRPVHSDDFGVWVQLDWRTFAYTDKAVHSDLSGNLKGFFKVRGIYTLDGSGDRYTGRSYYEFLDKDDKTVTLAGWVCNEGVRILVEAPPKDPPPPEQCVPEQP